MSGAPDWLIAHRELQYLRAAASATKRKSRRKKKGKKEVPLSYVANRYEKLKEVKDGN